MITDTPLNVIKALEPMKIEGLYAYDRQGNKVTPYRIYFGINMRELTGNPNETTNGTAYFHYDNALRPVFKADCSRLVLSHLSNVCCSYDNGILHDWYRE